MNYRAHGYLAAVDYSSINSSQISELGKLYPNVIRIDVRDLLRHDVLNPLITTAHDQGTDVLVTNIYKNSTSTEKCSARRCGSVTGKFPVRTFSQNQPSADTSSPQIPDGGSGYGSDNKLLQKNNDT